MEDEALANDQLRENSPQEGVVVYKAYKRRWWVLGTFSLLALIQCTVWNTWGPIDLAIKNAYGWSNGTIAMMANWGTIMFVLTIFPLVYLLEIKGIRVATITIATLVAIGTVLRVISTEDTVFLVFAHICAILNGIAGATVMSAPPAISAVWFPPKERTTATAINQVFNQLGNGVAFMLGPYLVPDGHLTSGNSTHDQHVKDEIRVYMGIDAGIALALLVAFLVYYPKAPPTPPSASATIPRTNFKQGLIELVKNRNVILCTFAYSISGGVFGAWQAVMTLNFAPLGVNDEEAGRIGLIQCFACVVIGISTAFFTDHIRKHMKVTLIVLLGIALICFIWLALLCEKAIPFRTWELYTAAVIGASAIFTLAPLFFEYTVELSYPVPEGVVGGFLTCFNNLFGGIFLSFFFIKNIGTVWMNYVLIGSVAASIPAVLSTKESYRRLDIDVPDSSRSSQAGIESSSQPYSVLE